MVNLHEFYLSLIEVALNANKLDVVNQPAGDKPAGALYALPKGVTSAELVITYAFEPMGANFAVASRSGKSLAVGVKYVEGMEGFLGDLVKFINAGRLAAPKR